MAPLLAALRLTLPPPDRPARRRHRPEAPAGRGDRRLRSRTPPRRPSGRLGATSPPGPGASRAPWRSPRRPPRPSRAPPRTRRSSSRSAARRGSGGPSSPPPLPNSSTRMASACSAARTPHGPPCSWVRPHTSRGSGRAAVRPPRDVRRREVGAPSPSIPASTSRGVGVAPSPSPPAAPAPSSGFVPPSSGPVPPSPRCRSGVEIRSPTHRLLSPRVVDALSHIRSRNEARSNPEPSPPAASGAPSGSSRPPSLAPPAATAAVFGAVRSARPRRQARSRTGGARRGPSWKSSCSPTSVRAKRSSVAYLSLPRRRGRNSPKGRETDPTPGGSVDGWTAKRAPKSARREASPAPLQAELPCHWRRVRRDDASTPSSRRKTPAKPPTLRRRRRRRPRGRIRRRARSFRRGGREEGRRDGGVGRRASVSRRFPGRPGTRLPGELPRPEATAAGVAATDGRGPLAGRRGADGDGARRAPDADRPPAPRRRAAPGLASLRRCFGAPCAVARLRRTSPLTRGTSRRR